MQALPADGVPAAQVLEEIAKLRATDLPTHGGRLFAYVYDPGEGGVDSVVGHLSDAGYLRLAATTLSAVRSQGAEPSTVDGLRLALEPESTVVVGYTFALFVASHTMENGHFRT